MGKNEQERLGQVISDAEDMITNSSLDVDAYFILAVGQAINGSEPLAGFSTNLSRLALVNTLRHFATMIELEQDNAPDG